MATVAAAEVATAAAAEVAMAAMDSVEDVVVMVAMAEAAVAIEDMESEALEEQEAATDKLCELNLLVVFNE